MTIRTTVNASESVSLTRAEFADLEHVLDGAHVSAKNTGYYTHKLAEIARGGAGDWYGCIGHHADIARMLREGWAEGASNAAQLTPKLAHLVPPPTSNRRKLRWQDDGVELSVDRAMNGQWDVAWRGTTRTGAGPRVISLGCNFGGAGSVSHEELFWCAAQMIVVTDVLENAGYAVELRALKCNRISSQQHVFIDVLVKRADQPLRADAVAAVFGHAGIYRSVGHCLLMGSPFDIGGGYGAPTSVGPTLTALAAEGMVEAPDMVIEQAYSLDDAVRNVTDTLRHYAAATSTTGV